MSSTALDAQPDAGQGRVDPDALYPTSVALFGKQFVALDRAAKATGLKRSDMIRIAVEEWRLRNPEPEPVVAEVTP